MLDRTDNSDLVSMMTADTILRILGTSLQMTNNKFLSIANAKDEIPINNREPTATTTCT